MTTRSEFPHYRRKRKQFGKNVRTTRVSHIIPRKRLTIGELQCQNLEKSKSKQKRPSTLAWKEFAWPAPPITTSIEALVVAFWNHVGPGLNTWWLMHMRCHAASACSFTRRVWRKQFTTRCLTQGARHNLAFNKLTSCQRLRREARRQIPCAMRRNCLTRALHKHEPASWRGASMSLILIKSSRNKASERMLSCKEPHAFSNSVNRVFGAWLCFGNFSID